MNKRYVITGGPGTGKSSIINELKKKNYACSTEISREIIQSELKTNGEVVPWLNLNSFSDKVVYLRSEQWLATNESETHFFDRGIIDAIAYLHNANSQVPESYINAIYKYPYNTKVFITPPWENIYQKDAERMESFKESERIHKQLVKSYENFGYKLIMVPKLSVSERVEFILSQI